MKRVAITGCGVVTPIGVGCPAFWDALTLGTRGVGPITHFDATTFEVQLAGEVNEPVALPEDVAQTTRLDPKTAFAYAATSEALASAGLDGLEENTLLHLGTSLEAIDPARLVHNGGADFGTLVAQSLADDAQPMQMPLDTACKLITERFGRPGQALTNCSACAASTQALGHGFHAVRAGRADVAVCGGFDSMINPMGVGGFQLLGALSTDNERGETACRPFDASRSGAVLGEGAAVFVLEPLEEAQSEGKTILGEFCGYGSTLDAYKVSAPDPEGDGALRAMAGALDDAGISPGDIAHISAHGTGTQLNDTIEASVIRRMFPQTWKSLPVSAAKSMTGHLIGASGAVEVAACLLAFVRGILPSNASLKRVGSGCELCHVTQPGTRFEGEYILKNSFGFGGQNAALVLRRPEEQAR